MTRRPLAQAMAENLIRRACRRLPGDSRDERYREWAAELPAILHDPDIHLAIMRSARALSYAAGVLLWLTLVVIIRAYPPSGSSNYLYAAAGLVPEVLFAVGIVRFIRWIRRQSGRARRP